MCATSCTLLAVSWFGGNHMARAGSWTYAVTGDNTGTTFTQNGTPGTLPSYSPSSSGSGSSASAPGYALSLTNASGIGCDMNVTVHATVKFTWHPAAGQTLTTDPAPPSVLVLETSSATWSTTVGYSPYPPGTSSGSADDGLHDAEVDVPLHLGNSSGSSAPPTQQGSSLVGQHLTSYTPDASGVVTVAKCTLTAHATATYPASKTYYYSGSASVGSYAVSIHAQPYNMQLTPYVDENGVTQQPVTTDNVGGRLLFRYTISSTDGNVADMTSCTAYEALDWSGNPAPPGTYLAGGYAPPSPPVQMYSNPTQLYAYKSPQTLTFPYLLKGYVLDGFSPPSTGFVAPYPAPSTVWKVKQRYLFDDSATGEVGTKIPGPDNQSPFTITRTVTPSNQAGTLGIYTINTRGHTAQELLP